MSSMCWTFWATIINCWLFIWRMKRSVEPADSGSEYVWHVHRPLVCVYTGSMSARPRRTSRALRAPNRYARSLLTELIVWFLCVAGPPRSQTSQHTRFHCTVRALSLYCTAGTHTLGMVSEVWVGATLDLRGPREPRAPHPLATQRASTVLSYLKYLHKAAYLLLWKSEVLYYIYE